MQDCKALTGAVMLETMWKTRKQDLIDLISPFITYGVAKLYSPYETIELRKVLDYVKSEFGYRDMPVSVIERIFIRNPKLFECIEGEKHKREYILNGNLDETVIEMDRRKADCDSKINLLGKQIAEYLTLHVSPKKAYNNVDAIDALQGFFSRNGAFLGTDQLEEHVKDLEGYEEDYYIAQYLYEKRETKSIEYEYVIDLIKGYFLQTAIYLQAENPAFSNESYKDVLFYYDTPFLLRLLGYKTNDDKLSSNDLHLALQNQGAKTYYFPQTKKEVINILKAYKKSIGYATDVTLEGLDELRYSEADVERLIASWQNRLEKDFSTFCQDVPPKKKAILIPKITEKDLKEFFSQNGLKWRSQTAMDADVESIIAIHNLRGDLISDDIENCRAVFVTTNTRLCRIFNEYYKKRISEEAFPPLITDSDLAALTWVKSGTTDNIPESQLLRNAYIACQPTPEMLEKFGQVLDRMQGEGKITQEIAIAIRTSRYTKKEVLFSTFSSGNGINENVVLKIEGMLKEEFSKDAREDEKYKAAQKHRRDHTDQLKRADSKARNEAKNAENNQLANERRLATFFVIILGAFAIIGMFKTMVGLQFKNIWVFLGLATFAVTTILSVIDTWRGKGILIDKWLIKRATRTYDRVLKEKTEEYRSILDDLDSYK